MTPYNKSVIYITDQTDLNFTSLIYGTNKIPSLSKSRKVHFLPRKKKKKKTIMDNSNFFPNPYPNSLMMPNNYTVDDHQSFSGNNCVNFPADHFELICDYLFLDDHDPAPVPEDSISINIQNPVTSSHDNNMGSSGSSASGSSFDGMPMNNIHMQMLVILFFFFFS